MNSFFSERTSLSVVRAQHSAGTAHSATRSPLTARPVSGDREPVALRTPVVPQEPRDIQSRLGRRVRELRRERNLTQMRMAVDFGIDRTFISDVERGRKGISLPMLEVIAIGMKLSLSDLLRGL